MVYALVTEVDKNALAMQFLRSKNIPEQNVCLMSNVNGLNSILSQGDTVWVLDVDRFGSVILFWNFYQVCKKKGVAIKFLANPYLNCGGGKELKSNHEKFIKFLMSVEHKMYSDLSRVLRNADDSEIQIYAGHIAINMLAEVFCTEGIMKRTSS